LKRCYYGVSSSITLHVPISILILAAEALFVDWRGVIDDKDENAGDIYVATKGACDGGVGKIPVSAHRHLAPGEVLSGFRMARVVDNLLLQRQTSCGDGIIESWTGADMRRDGQLIAVNLEGPRGVISFFLRPTNQSVGQALSASRCDYEAFLTIGSEDERKFEALAFVDSEGLRLAHISECTGVCAPFVFEFDLDY
jgi:hypothetical protein